MDVKQNVYLLTKDCLIPNNMRSGNCYSVVWVVRAGGLAGHPVLPRMGTGQGAGQLVFACVGAEGGASAGQGAGQLVFACVGAEGGASAGQGAGQLVFACVGAVGGASSGQGRGL